MQTLVQLASKNYLKVVYLISLISVLASLYFSEVEKLAPCNLCWWQRIFMYPLVAISFIAINKKDNSVWKYILPLTLLGNMVAIYHVILQAAGESSGLPGCTAATGQISCSIVDVTVLGFITIPMLSAAAFAVINIFIGAYVYTLYKRNKQ